MQADWIDIRHPETGKLLFRLHKDCTMVHIKPPHQPGAYIDLHNECKKAQQGLDKTASSDV